MSLLDGHFRGPSTPSRNRPHGNLLMLRVAVLVLFGVLAVKLVDMQIIHGSAYAQRSRENHITQTTQLPPRGLIIDRNGEQLVTNVGVYTATITPLFLPEKQEDRYRIYLRLEQIVGVPALEIQERVKEAEDDNREFLEIPIKKSLTKEQALTLDEASTDMPGVALSIKPGRDYVGGEEFSQMLGYVGDQDQQEHEALKDSGYALNEPIGKDGLEAKYEADLRGTRGVTAAEQDAQGQLIRALETKDPVPGNSLKLAIDAGLQRYVAELLQDSLAGASAFDTATNAAAVVMNAKTGEVYALVSIPMYDNNIFNDPDNHSDEFRQLVNDPRHPFLNQALSAAAPGSTFKLLTASAALQNGNITPSSFRNVSSTVLEIKGENGVIYPLYDWKAHGPINFFDAIAWSSNIFFYMASCGIPQEGIKGLGKDSETSATILGYYARAFGFGQPTGIDLAGEGSGIIPSPEWKRRAHSGPEFNPEDRAWYYADTCFMGIGQGDVTATPLQVARMTAAVANGGHLLTPHLVNQIVSPDGKVVRDIAPQAKDVPVSAQHLAEVRQGMHQSVGSGAGIRAQTPGVDIAGKTGTAEFYLPDGTKLQHAWFTGFAPFDDPEVVVTVYFDRGVGGDKAAPVAGKIFDYFMKNVQP